MAREFAIQNPKQLLENMVLIRDILQSHEIRCFLHYGTLLGAIREKDFIPHDDDADLGVFYDDFDKLLNIVPLLLQEGFSFESVRKGRLLQFIRNDEQVDLFVAIPKKIFWIKQWWIDERVAIKASHLDKLETIIFLDEDFLIPTNPEKLMKFLYGKTWQTPLAHIPSKTGIGWKIKKLLNEPKKLFFYIKRFLKTQKKKNK